jgi:hypothetical protein
MDEAALKSLVESLQAQKDALDIWLNIFSGMVAVGVIAEIIFVIRGYANDLHEWQRGIARPPDRPSRIWFVLEIFGVALVSIGVAGEFAVDVRAGSLETQVRKANSDLVLFLEKRVAEVSTRQSPRIIDPAKFSSALKDKPVRAAELLYNPIDTEAYLFAEQIRDCLGHGFRGSGAGWDVSEPRPIPPTGGDERFPNAPPQIRYGTLAGAGLTFVFNKKEMKNADRDALHGLEFAITNSSSRGLPVLYAERDDSTLPDGVFIVVIGQKM